MTTSTHNGRIRAIDLRRRGRALGGAHDRLRKAVAATEHLSLYSGFVAHSAFDYGSVENSWITPSPDRHVVAVLDVLRDDRRLGDRKRTWMHQAGGRGTGRRGRGPAPIREEVDLFREEKIRDWEWRYPQLIDPRSHFGVPRQKY